MGRDDMIVQYFYLDDYDWRVTVFYINGNVSMSEINDELKFINCEEDRIKEINNSLINDLLNIGFTITNKDMRHSVVIIGDTTNAAEFQDTFDHEKGHLAKHISLAIGLDPYGEEMEYLTGSIGKSMFPVAKYFLCDDCRNKLFGE